MVELACFVAQRSYRKASSSISPNLLFLALKTIYGEEEKNPFGFKLLYLSCRILTHIDQSQ
jgi:hypothetical protein